MIRAVLLLLLVPLPLMAQKHEMDITPTGGWTDTGIELHAGDSIHITASGQLKYVDAIQSCTPAGLPRAFLDLLRAMPVNDAGRGALVGRIGSSAAARPFFAGEELTMRAPIAGRFYLSINQPSTDRPAGSYHVVIEHTAAAKPMKMDVHVTPFPQKLLDSIPRRVNDASGNLGDRVNFILIGSKEQVQAALKAAGWVMVDRTQKDAILRGLFASLSKEAYVTMPMSELELFGRAQDFGYAQADPLRVIASRHHFRIWKLDQTLDGQQVWAGAGTHDIGFDRDQRNNGITHKIDPDTDSERDYIRDSLMQTGMVVKSEYMTPTDPVLSAHVATGAEFHSDGRTLLVYLAGGAGDVSAKFGEVFCSVLKQNNPDTGDWGTCSNYIDKAGRDDMSLAPLPTQYRVLIVPGILSSCVADTHAFDAGMASLKERGVDVDLLPVPNDSSESNAQIIADYLHEHAGNDPRKYILVGYSKGTPDIQVALAENPTLREHVAAFVTVAGASGGSVVADLLPQMAEKYMTMNPMKTCKGDLASGFRSLQRTTRRAFLAAHPDPVVPTYSIIAQSSASTTSKALMQTWQILSSYGMAEDGQLLREDAVAPGAKYLGAALADHFAIAMPFNKSSDSALRSGMDKTTYPRAALLESLVRFVSADLNAKQDQAQ
ncbi:MAG: LssY C-terminal domain-containing protein [Acidobacteriota bacterium]|nr:LssY C-terminal domain-containing protein [Acidobacteriota bacterium]